MDLQGGFCQSSRQRIDPALEPFRIGASLRNIEPDRAKPRSPPAALELVCEKNSGFRPFRRRRLRGRRRLETSLLEMVGTSDPSRKVAIPKPDGFVEFTVEECEKSIPARLRLVRSA